jgi:ferrochelatase
MTGVLLINMGGPENPDQIKSFLYRLFNDRHIISLPQPFRFLLAKLISRIRTSKAKNHYNLIGGGSPIKKWTSVQAEKLEKVLSGKDQPVLVGTAYSYSDPLIGSAVSQLINNGVEKIIAIPLYPQYSGATFASIVYDLEKARRKYSLGGNVIIVEPYYNHDKYINASAELLKTAVEHTIDLSSACVIFTAHSLPQKLVDRGDPYPNQIKETISLILEKVPVENYLISFQSKIGPVKWMQPSTVDTILKAARDGYQSVIVVPIGFVCDHIETLYELDIELADIAKTAGIKQFVRGPVLNDHPAFIDMLATLVEGAIDA